MKTVSPYALEEYFSSGYEESANPFITTASRSWGKHVALLGSLSALLFLIAAYFLRSPYPALSSLFLVFTYFLAGTPSLIRSLEDIIDWNINIQVLMTLAALLSVLIGSELEGGLLLVLFALSEALEESVTQKTKGALNALHKLSPTTAFVVGPDETISPRSVREIELNTHIFVKAGEVIPLDGIVIHGSSYITLAHLTGESVPVSKKPGDEVPAGALNTDGSLTIRVTKTSSESTLAKIIRLISEAQESKPKLQRFLDQFSRQYASSIILLALTFGLFLPFLFPNMTYVGTDGSIYRALAFLIAASPCALIIATPTAYLSAISACAKRGILLKGGITIDALAKCKLLVFDKTGTLTTGNLSCTQIEIDGQNLSQELALSIAAGLERSAHHPIADAITRYAESHQIKPAPIDTVRVLPGKGVEGVWTGKRVLIGNPEFILSFIPARKAQTLEKLQRAGHVVTLLLVEETLLIFHFADELRSNLSPIIASLKKTLDIAMLTGDHKENALGVANALGITNVYADLSPEDKLRHVRELGKNRPLIMVGDGINDAPALTSAMVGIAMGQVGSASAIEAADVVLLRDDLGIIGWLHKKSRQTMRIVRQNLTLALLVIAFTTTFSLLGFVPLWLAVILHEGSTVTVGLNSLRLFWR